VATGHEQVQDRHGLSGQANSGAFPWRNRLRRVAPCYRDALAVFGLALGLRLVFSVLLADTFDEDEFVYLALGRDLAHGALPYRDFPFFHPPGILVVLQLLEPLTTVWWPLARLVDVVVDSVTATLVWRLGMHLYGRRPALAAGIVYAANPVALVSAVRVDQEVLMTALGMAGLTLLLTKRSTPASGYTVAGLAGACLGAACWIKYPMLVFLPVYLVAAPRRALACLVGWLAATVLLFAPYVGDVHRLYDDTVAWQLVYRSQTPLNMRVTTTVIFWLLINPFAVAAILRGRQPLWLMLGFGSGCLFLFGSSTYSHYFVPVAPFAALLSAVLAARLVRTSPRVTVLGALAITIGWGMAVLTLVSNRGYVIATRFSDVRPVVQLIDRSTRPGAPILANRFEYAYLGGRTSVAHYFWNDHDVVDARYLERRLKPGNVVVLQPHSDPVSYPKGFTAYLDAHFVRLQVRRTAIWLIT
jgi:hypothetical protein